MLSSFAPLNLNQFSRRWGSTGASAVDPYISGYFFTRFSQLPDKLPDMIRSAYGNLNQFNNASDIQNLLAASCQSVTLPGATVNKTEFTGLGGIRWSVPTNVEWDNTFTMRFVEFSGVPIHAVFNGWARMIRDYRSGVTPLSNGNDRDAYRKSEYACTVYYWTTKPDGRILEIASCLTGVFPLKDPTDQYGHDLATNDKIELDIDFNVDVVYQERWVRDACERWASEYYNQWGGINGNGIINRYGPNEDGIS